MRGLFWFRNDLRLQDNPALSQLTAQCKSVMFVYIIDERWFAGTRFQTKPLGTRRAVFIKQSLADLRQALVEKGQELIILTGKPELVISELIDTYRIDALGVSRLPATYERRQLKRLMTSYPEMHWIIEDGFTLFGEPQLPFLLANLPDHFTPFRKLAECISVTERIDAPRREK